MPRVSGLPMRTLRQVLSASWSTMDCTLRTLSAKGMRIGSFSSAVYTSISKTVRLSISASARAPCTVQWVSPSLLEPRHSVANSHYHFAPLHGQVHSGPSP